MVVCYYIHHWQHWASLLPSLLRGSYCVANIQISGWVHPQSVVLDCVACPGIFHNFFELCRSNKQEKWSLFYLKQHHWVELLPVNISVMWELGDGGSSNSGNTRDSLDCVKYHEIIIITFNNINDNVNKYKNLQLLSAAEPVH